MGGCPGRNRTLLGAWRSRARGEESVRRGSHAAPFGEKIFLYRTVPGFYPGNLQWPTIMLVSDKRDDARSTMNDNPAERITAPASTAGSATAGGGLIDVEGLNFDELSTAITCVDLKLALDYIVASGQNGTGYHGFNSSI